jgi:hypothetical protein
MRSTFSGLQSVKLGKSTGATRTRAERFGATDSEAFSSTGFLDRLRRGFSTTTGSGSGTGAGAGAGAGAGTFERLRPLDAGTGAGTGAGAGAGTGAGAADSLGLAGVRERDLAGAGAGAGAGIGAGATTTGAGVGSTDLVCLRLRFCPTAGVELMMLKLVYNKTVRLETKHDLINERVHETMTRQTTT